MSVNGGDVQVHRDVLALVDLVGVEVLLEARRGEVLLGDDRRRRIGHRAVELALRDPVEDVRDVRIDRDRDAVEIVGARRVGRLDVVRVPHQRDLPGRVEAGDRLDRRAGRDVDVLLAGEHVRPGRDQVTAVVARLEEALRDLLRDRRRGRRGEPLEEVAGGRRQVEDDRRRVRRRDSRDARVRVLRLAGQPLDDSVVVVAVLRHEGRVVDPLERVLDVLRGDLAVERRAPLDVLLEVERVGEPAVGRLRHGRRQVGRRHEPGVAGDVLEVDERAAGGVVDRPGEPDLGLTGRIEAVGQPEARDGRPVDATSLRRAVRGE